MKRLFNNRTIETTSSEKTLQQGRLANMRTLTLRRLFSLAGMAVLLGAMVFTVHGATIDGTDRADVLDDQNTSDEVFGLGGDDTITVDNGDNLSDTVFAGPGDDNIIAAATSSGNVSLFGEDGDDTFRLNNTSTTTARGSRGNDFFNISSSIGANSELVDGPGQDTFIDSDGTNVYTISLVADNEQDTVRLTDANSGGQTIRLAKGSGRDAIDCGDDANNGDLVFLNGNRKATDLKGNNLRKAALLGGTAESGCDTIIP